ncbi:MAG: WYL domain-containing protein [Prevotella sp.]|nr:WYL domain-containing protein [Prevotella sp.]
MRNDKLERELEMLLLLTGNHRVDIDQACTRLGISRRSFYYYLEFFRDYGFNVERNAPGVFTIGRESPFFRRLIDRVSLTEAEVIVMQRLLSRVAEKNAVVEGLREKLRGYYDFSILDEEQDGTGSSLIVDQLHDAIKYKKMAVLRSYSSPHGQTSRDRLVEPFMLMNGNQEVRCYEPASAMNKTFKIARIGTVDLLSDNWMNEHKHRRMFTDIFMFSGETTYTVTLTMGRLAYNLMVEELPRSAPFITALDDGRWHLAMPVCNYAGIGRFVLGLMEDITVEGDNGFIAYLQQRIQAMDRLLNNDEGV